MPRGRQFYDPIIQAPSKVESASSRRIELYPEQDVRDNAVTLRWVGRLVDDNGVILDKTQGSFDHDDALRQAQELWPSLEVFELREESEDSTWDGMGPSPRLWQNQSPFPQPALQASEVGLFDKGEIPAQPADVPPAVDNMVRLIESHPESPETGARMLHAIVAAVPGSYVHINDVVLLLEEYAQQYDDQGNPSGALALREAAAALREPF